MTLALRVIPCLDVHDGRVVKGVNFRNLRDAGDPVELAAAYGAEGADELVFLDISASADGRATTYDVVTRTAETVFIPLCVGGGVRGVEDVDRLLRTGADKVGINTGAINRPPAIDEIVRLATRKNSITGAPPRGQVLPDHHVDHAVFVFQGDEDGALGRGRALPLRDQARRECTAPVRQCAQLA